MSSHYEMLRKLVQFRDARDWKGFHTPENLSKAISIEAGELLEHFQWGDPWDKNEVKDELADVLIYCYLMADSLDLDPLEVMAEKLARNESRFPADTVRGTSGKTTKQK